MGNIVPYLSVKNAAEALKLYEEIFDAKVLERIPVDPKQAPGFNILEGTDLEKTTMHGSFTVMDQLLHISDNFTGKVLESTNVSLMLQPTDLEEMRVIYTRAKDNGCTITMELERQFWGDYFTSFIDPFGINWQMNFSPKQD